MAIIELPHSAGCLVCGHSNPHGLHLHLIVDTNTGIVHVEFLPLAEHIGFEGIIHGGVIATIVDEAMVWAATWAGNRFCVCGEMTVRFRMSAEVGRKINITAQVDSVRSRLIQCSSTVSDDRGILSTASGKYIPVSPDRHDAVMQTLVEEPATVAAVKLLRERKRK